MFRIVAIIVASGFVLIFLMLIGNIALWARLKMTRGIPNKQYIETPATISSLYCIKSQGSSSASRSAYYYEFYCTLKYSANEKMITSSPYLIAQCRRFSDAIKRLDSQFGQVPFDYYYTACTDPKRLSNRMVRDDEELQLLADLEPRKESIGERPILYNANIPSLFEFKSVLQSPLPWFMLCLGLFAWCGIGVLDYCIINQGFHLSTLNSAILTTFLLLAALMLPKFFPGFFTKGFQKSPYDSSRSVVFTIGPNNSAAEIQRQIDTYIKTHTNQ
jgi:hypothetical protein